jgi:UDP-N-acetylmuramoyl-L-alanyl-D-glutamate--2,6-diaminopimelate ligase
MGVRTAVLEVSSQALATDRVHGIPFSVGIFTNVSRDHIGVGEHADMEEYVGAKLRLFTEYDLHLAVLNAADAISRTVLARTRAREILLFGKRRGLPFSYGHVTPLIKGGRLMTEFTLKLPDGRHRVCIPFAGEHYVQDYLGALASASAIAGVDAANLLPFAEGLTAKGRCETVTLASGALAVIDYAHNGASLAAALRGLRPYARGRLLCLFGAVGEHSSCRRADMARAASRYADLSVITEDNPGGEDPTCIVQEIYKAFPKRQRAVCMPDRGAAISYLASVAGKDDVILLAGKGDEEFQLRKEGKIPFSEKELLQKFTSH